MSDLKPLGSERLSGDDKIKRIMEIANYGRSNNVVSENKKTSVEYLKESKVGTYGIVKEKDGYYVKKGLNESTLDYIGGIFMKNKNRFSSYSEALKRLELISGQEELNEAKKYVLKSKSEKPAEAVAPEAPIEDIPAPVEDPIDDAPVDDLPPADAGIEGDDEGGEEEEIGKRSDYMAEVQKFSGKLGQALRDVKERMESDDIKYVINMVLSAVNLDSLDEEDREEIAEKFEPKDDDFSGDDEGLPTDDLPMDDEGPSDDEVDGEVDEIMDKLESFVNDTPIVQKEEEPIIEKSIEDYADLSVKHEGEVEEGDDSNDTEEIGEIDLDQLKSEINKHVDETLSKYFQ